MRLLVATTNAGKLREIRSLLTGLDVDLTSLADYPPVAEPEETGATFQANARLKAVAYASACRQLTVAEDSGLEVDALGGGPGIHSARFLGPDASYAERFAAIYQAVQRPDAPRSARFVCALAVAEPDGRIRFEARGVVEGVIADTPAGTDGFGYDPIFMYPPYGKTLAQVSTDEKLHVAHRGHAFRQLAGWLRDAKM